MAGNINETVDGDTLNHTLDFTAPGRIGLQLVRRGSPILPTKTYTIRGLR